ncbi:PKD domain-containing protein [Chitinophaga sp. CF418]|uniref:PKD domain-containing protein n=1 Tax=Chitinophaga sp. CF418 TaxID=1855287 RepID=UPI0009102094|nr:PKD domain-containing protein [Chitinophaga sp. CF418]SHM77203.1 PKD domain-containing protein [Chitinophaga sp. CF418]
MKRSLLAVLLLFASIGTYANTTIQSASGNVVTKVTTSTADTLPTPDFIYYIRPVGSPYPGARLVSFIVSVPGPGEHDLIGSVDWDFGDGTSPALNTIGIVNHAYYQAGTFDVTMTFHYVTGETFVIVKPITITL